MPSRLARLSCVAALVLLYLSSKAYGEVGIVLDEALGTGLARIVATGHSAVYLSRICPDSPVRLRICRDDEHGSILSTYPNLREDIRFEWNVVPLYIYLYGVDKADSRPVFGSKKIKRALEDRYREKYLSAYCASEVCARNNEAEWREMVGAALVRSIYIFAIETTLQQDLDFIALFNSIPNVNHFNYMTRNCANFTQRVINTYFPHAVHAHYINDFGLASPKGIAHSFTRYALKHSDLHFGVLHFGQLPGTIKRSSEARDGTEQLYRSKNLVLPMIVLANHELPVFGAAHLAYLFTRRFNPEKALEQHPGLWPDRAQNQRPNVGENQQGPVGRPEDWKRYRRALNTIADLAARQGAVLDSANLRSLFRKFDKAGTLEIDVKGDLWTTVSLYERTAKVGLSACNLLSPESDRGLAYILILAHNEFILNSPKHNETILEFQKDWKLMQDAGPENNGPDSGWLSALLASENDRRQRGYSLKRNAP